jgi:predicted permease
MYNVALLALCLALGVVLRYFKAVPENTAPVLNGFIINISLPALILLHVHQLRPSFELLYPVLMPWVMFAVGFMFFRVAGHFVRWTPQSIGALILTGSLANTSFVGLPMIEAYYGNDNNELALGMLIDQLGTYLVLSTVGILVAVLYSSSGQASLAAVGKKILTFPPFLALVAALALASGPVELPQGVDEVLERLGATLTPLALVSVGYQLRLSEIKGRFGQLSTGLLYSLVLAPAFILVFFSGLTGGAGGRIMHITVFEAAMPPQIGAAIVAMEHKLEPALVALMVGIGIPLSFLTLIGWYYFLGG